MLQDQGRPNGDRTSGSQVRARTCHASVMPTYRRIGNGDVSRLKRSANVPYGDACEVVKTGSANPIAGGSNGGVSHVDEVPTREPRGLSRPGQLPRVTRPGFVRGIQALASGAAPAPQIRCIERWRRGSRATPYDPNVDASRQEMRSFVCGRRMSLLWSEATSSFRGTTA